MIIAVIMFSLSSCAKTEEPELPPKKKGLQEFMLTSTNSSITVNIVQADSISWYDMYIGKQGDSLIIDNTKQDLLNDTMTYTFNSLDSNTTYTIKIEGRTYAVGGDILTTGSKDILTD